MTVAGLVAFYLLMCLECGKGDPAVPFGSAAERGKWAAGHTRTTGHDRWLVWQETREARP